MPVTPTYPGIYIEEVHSNAHTITAAPTSVTVFVGYTHPFRTKPSNWGKAIQIFSFTDYEREFGGLYAVDWLACDVGRAVNEFFLNGGAVAYVVALRPRLHDLVTLTSADITPPTFDLPGAAPGTGIRFTGREPVDAHRALTVSVTNLRATTGSAPLDLADLVVTYGSRTETFRRVTLNPAPSAADAANTVDKRLGTATAPVSSLVMVEPITAYPTAWPTSLAPTPLTATMPGNPFTTYSPGDFAPAFAADGSLDKVPVFNLLLTPGVWDQPVVSDALAFAERKRAFVIMDPPADSGADHASDPLPLIGEIMTDAVPGRVIPKSQNGALYFPYLKSTDPETGAPVTVAPSGFVAGVIAREDTNRGVWKAPAGLETIIADTTGVVASGVMTDARHGTLNPIGVNCLRGFPGIGTVVFGARTLVAANPAFQQYRYVPVRRMALFLEQSLASSLTWVTFEPNDGPLWVSIRTTIENFMLGLFHQGAFQGSKPSQAFQVVCDASTTTPDDQANGIVNIVVAFAPLKPAEFVVIKLAQLAGQPAV
ncbi:tail protein [Catellatospora sp. TT07R-123]|uniref:phage tail sheath family protein n=1 Tax=Catellatospora sp. TT07R-123 TaxID=2733863 RepID=UPI001B12E703|nr:phage tail sheath subtilisin-like domain-containing protein [Catellatospora sp. TT07R-123]GHJ47501.1 tail protein [Catellatospora sp. TT07R-123]